MREITSASREQDGSPPLPRLVSLDQFRGYTVVGMFLVNFVGSYEAIQATLPLLKHHHTFCSYADTIMPQFFLAVGFAYRLTFLRRMRKFGARSAYWHVFQRCLGLLLVGFVIHHLDGQYASWSQLREAGWTGVLGTAFQRNFFQTLTHIAITSIWIMPVIATRMMWRVLWAIASGAVFHLISEYGYYEWVMHRPGIDGGPLGFLTWTIPMIAGTLAYDIVQRGQRMSILSLSSLAVLLMSLGYGLSCLGHLNQESTIEAGSELTSRWVEPPFVPPSKPVTIWTMSQRAGSVSYLTFGAGFSLAVYVLFVIGCDIGRLQLGVFRTLGTNALAGYVFHSLVNDAIQPFVPKDSALWYVFAGFFLSFAICYVLLRHLENNRIFLKL